MLVILSVVVKNVRVCHAYNDNSLSIVCQRSYECVFMCSCCTLMMRLWQQQQQQQL